MLPLVMLHVIQSSFVVPRLTTLETMKFTHYPERLVELTNIPLHFNNLSPPVNIGNLTLTRFNAHNGNRHFGVHMFSNNPNLNTAVICERDKPIVTLTLYSYCVQNNTIIQVRCEMMEHTRGFIQKIMSQFTQCRMHDFLKRRPLWSENLLTTWRLCVFNKAPTI